MKEFKKVTKAKLMQIKLREMDRESLLIEAEELLDCAKKLDLEIFSSRRKMGLTCGCGRLEVIADYDYPETCIYCCTSVNKAEKEVAVFKKFENI